MPTDPRKRPDDKDFDDLSKHYGGIWEKALSDMKEIDGIYYQTEDIWTEYYNRFAIPQVQRKRPNVHTGVGPALVDQAVAAHLPQEPQFRRNPNGKGVGHEEAASRVEKGLQAVYYDAMLRMPNIATIENGKQIQMYNVTWLRTAIDLDSLERPFKKDGEGQEDFEQREAEWEMTSMGWNPIKLYVPQPGEVLMSPMETVPGVAIWRRSMKVYELQHELAQREIMRTSVNSKRYSETYVGKFGLKGREAYDDVDTETWESAYWIVLREKGGEVLYSEPNTWGFQPWAQRFGGNAISPSNEKFNVQWWVRQSFLWKEKDTIRMVNQATAAHHHLLMRKAMARLVTEEDAAVVAAAMQRNIIPLKPADIGIEPTPDFPGANFQHLQELRRMIEETSYSTLVAGFRQAGVDTATGQLILSEAANRTFKANITSVEYLHTIGGQNVLRLVDVLNKDRGKLGQGRIEQGETVLDANDIGGKFHIQAKLRQIDQVARQQAVQEALQLRSEGLVGDDYVYESAGIEDTSGTRIDAIKSLARRDPEYLAKLTIDALREDGMNELADKREDDLKAMKAQAALEGTINQNSPTPAGANGTNGRQNQSQR